MKRFGFAAAAVVAAVAPGVASAEGLYGKVDAGIGLSTEVELTSLVDGETAASDSGNADQFITLSGALGKSFGKFRAEGEFMYASIDGGDDDNTEVSSLIGFANLFYDIPTQSGFTPYVGGGIGYGQTELEAPEVLGIDFSGEETGVAWHLSAGLSFETGANGMIDVGYRYLSLPTYEANETELGLPISIELEATSHQLTAAYRFGLGS